jgi:membrane associated rhomboid family serine protease
MAAAAVVARSRGLGLMESGLGIWIGLNLLITFTIPNISIGGHIGGLIGGAAAALGLSRFGRAHIAYGRPGMVGVATMLAVGAAAVVVAYWKAKGYSIPGA